MPVVTTALKTLLQRVKTAFTMMLLLLVLGRQPALSSFPKVVGALTEWAHSHFSDCLVEFNATHEPSVTSSCKLSEGAYSVEGLAVYGIPADKRDLPPALVFCADRLHAAHKQQLNRFFKHASAVRGRSKLRSTTRRTLYVSKLLNATATNMAVAFPAEPSPFVPLILGQVEQENFDESAKRCEPRHNTRDAKCACAGSENSEEHTPFSLGKSVLGFLQRHWFTLCYSLFLQRLVSRAWFLGE